MTATASDTSTVLHFMAAAQTILACFSSPNMESDDARCKEILSELLESKELLEAQARLGEAPEKIYVIEGTEISAC